MSSTVAASTPSIRPPGVSGPGKIRGTAHLDPIGRSTYNPPLPADGYVQATLVTGKPNEPAETDPIVLMTTVGDHNAFEFEDLPLGVYLVRVVGDGRTSVNSVALTSGEPEIFVSVGHAFTIAPSIGRVTDPQGQAVEDASVWTVDWRPSPNDITPEWQYISGSHTRTGADGRFVLDYTGTGDRAPREYRVLVRKDGLAPFVSDWFEGGTQDLEFRMTRGETVAGLVIDSETKEPVAKQRIRIATDVYWDARETVTDAEGRFQFERVSAGNYEMSTLESGRAVTTEDRALTVSSESRGPVAIRVTTGGVISGRVAELQSGEGLPGVNVRLYRPGKKVQRGFYIAYNVDQSDAHTTTDAEGKFSFIGLADGEYEVDYEDIPGLSKLMGNASRTRTQQITVTGGNEVPVQFAVNIGATISGRVVDGNGRGLTDIVVMAFEPHDHPADVMYDPTGENYTVTDPRGVFHLSGLDRDRPFSLLAEHDKPRYADPGYAALAVGPFNFDDGLGPIEIVMQPESRITAKVIHPSGVPISGARIHANRVESGGREFHFRATSPEGIGVVDKLVEGTYEFFVDVPQQGGQEVGPLARVHVDAGEHAEVPPIVYQSPSGIELTGRVTDTSGRPVSKAQVTLGGRITETGIDGAFVLMGLDEQSMALDITHGSFTPYFVPEYVPSRAPLYVQLRGKGTGRADVYRDGVPVVRFRVLTVPLRDGINFDDAYLVRLMSTPSGTRGKYGNFEVPLNEGDSAVVVFADDLAPQYQIVRGMREHESRVLARFNLDDGALLNGVVIDPDGRPAAGAKVSIGFEGSPNGVRSDKDGKFRIAGLPMAQFTIWITADGLPPQRFIASSVARSDQLQTFVLSRGNVVTGVLVIDGTPIPNTELRARIVDPMTMSSVEDRRVSTDANGRYAFEGLRDGTAQIYAEFATVQQERAVLRTIDIDGGRHYEFNLDVTAGTAGIRGNVVDSRNRPVAATLEIQVIGLDPAVPGISAGDGIKVQVNGKYELYGLPAGPCMIQATVEGAPGQGVVSMTTTQTTLRENEVTSHDIVMPPQ